MRTIVLCSGITPADREASINLAIIPSVSLKTYILYGLLDETRVYGLRINK